MRRKKYNSHTQEGIKAETHERVLIAARDLFLEKWVDEIKLQDVAEKAGVTVQTLIRHFGSREQLLRTAVEEIDLGAEKNRIVVTNGKIQDIVKSLTDYYEEYGLWILRCLAQENRIPELDFTLQRGREQHRSWVRKCFSHYLKNQAKNNYIVLEDQLYALTEVYFWRVYRIDLKKKRIELESAWADVLSSVTN